MSLAQDYLDRRLKLDVEGYLRGEMPRPIALERAPLLENWRVVLLCELSGKLPLARLAGDMSLVGNVTHHPSHGEGELIRTAKLVWLDRYGKWARTKDRLFLLGQRSTLPSSSDELALDRRTHVD
jgi:hypothetical protein